MTSVYDLSRFIRWTCRAMVGGSGLIAAVFWLVSPVAADDIPPRLLDAKGWRGTIVASVKGLEDDDTYARHDAVMVCEVLVDEFDDSDPDLPTWHGKIVSSNLESSYESLLDPEMSLRRETSFKTAGPLELKAGRQAKLIFHGSRGWSFELTTAQRKGVVEMVMPRMKPRIRRQETADITGMTKPSTVVRFPEKRMVLFGSGEVKGVPISYSVLQIQGGQIDETWEWTAYFEPTSVEELKLEITEPGNYVSWRPETTRDREKGPPLEVTATLVSSKGGKPNARVEKFIWELKGTSREPGVTLNFPLGQTTDRPDLELDASGAGIVLSEEKQKLERDVTGGLSDTVSVVPYDWGAWSTLHVTAVLADGRRVSGKLKGQKELGLRVPKRDVDSNIADGWKNQNGVSGADDIDDEKIAGQKENGDGFTLYEEYRGWIEDGMHLGGDPVAKDFFVLNLVGADAEPGIDLFASLSQLAVHSKLRPEEMSEKKRLMNGNRGKGARNEEQHGVWVKTYASKSELGDDGALTVMNKKGVAGRPGLVDGIGILAREDTESAFNKPFNLAATDALVAYDRAIAHELLHSVGVEHHGKQDDIKIDLIFISAKDPANRLGRPHFATTGGTVFNVLSETNQDVAAQFQSDFGWAIDQARIDLLPRYLTKARKDFEVNQSYQVKSKYASPEAQADAEFFNDQSAAYALHGLIGVRHGAHSGDQDCVMRYYFAKFYEAKDSREKLYVVTPGTERIGVDICHAGTGTGINGADHTPQSRYGDAASGAGNCFSQICPNDAVPPR